MSTNIFEEAARNKLRFKYNGLITAEDLWDLPLTALDNIYVSLKGQLHKLSGESLLDQRTNESKTLQLMTDVVKYVFLTKQEEAEAREVRAKNRMRKNRLQEIIQQKQEEELYEKDIAELESLIEELS